MVPIQVDLYEGSFYGKYTLNLLCKCVNKWSIFKVNIGNKWIFPKKL